MQLIPVGFNLNTGTADKLFATDETVISDWCKSFGDPATTIKRISDNDRVFLKSRHNIDFDTVPRAKEYFLVLQGGDKYPTGL